MSKNQLSLLDVWRSQYEAEIERLNNVINELKKQLDELRCENEKR